MQEQKGGYEVKKVVLTERTREQITAEYLHLSVVELRRGQLAGLYGNKGPECPKAIADALTEFLNHLRRRRQEVYGKLSAGTLRGYAYDIGFLGSFLKAKLPGGKLHEVTADHIRAWLNLPPQTRKSGGSHIAVATYQRKLQLLRQLFAYAEYKLWVRESPVQGLRNPRQDLGEPRFLTEAEYRQSLQRLSSPRDRMLARVMGECGLRISAALHLKVRDVILHPRDGDPPRLLYLRKGGQPGQAIILPALIGPLSDYIVEQGLVGHPRYYLFFPANKPWQPLDASQATRILERALGQREKGIKPTPHSYRHRFGHRMRMMGVDLEDLREFMGHASVKTTQIYAGRSWAERHRDLLRKHPMGGMSSAEVAQEPEA